MCTFIQMYETLQCMNTQKELDSGLSFNKPDSRKNKYVQKALKVITIQPITQKA